MVFEPCVLFPSLARTPSSGFGSQRSNHWANCQNSHHCISVPFVSLLEGTSRERPRSAPNLRLKNSKTTSQSVNVFFSVPEKSKSWTELARQGDAVRFFIHYVANHEKNWRKDPLVKFFSEKNLTMQKKTERGTLCVFSTSSLSQDSKKIWKTSRKVEITSELWKCYIRTLKTLYRNFKNVTSEFWKRYIRTFKT